MTVAENIFIFSTSIALLILLIWVKNIDCRKFGLKPESLFNGWWQVFLFNASVFVLVQLVIVNAFIDFPSWIVDKDPLLPLVAIVFLQEIIFRGLVIGGLERWGRQKALWASVVIFVVFHLVTPYSWSSAGFIFAGLTLVGGYFWGWHFLKFRNIYLLTISHLLVNLSFNYVFLQFAFK